VTIRDLLARLPSFRRPAGKEGNQGRTRRALLTLVLILAVYVIWWGLLRRYCPAGVVVQGMLIGALTALIAFGLALIWRANRIINFAQGDLGGVPATLAILLIVGPGVSYFLALLVGVAAALVLGAAVEFLIIRRFFQAPRLILTVATIGLAQVLAGAELGLPQAFNLQVPPQSFPSPFEFAFRISPIIFHGNAVIAMLAVPVAIAGLTAFLRFTYVGVAVRASAESAERAYLLGIPVRRVQTVVWVVATLLASVAMFMRASVVGLPIGSVLGPGVLLRALAAAVVGRMERLPVIFAASVALGVVEQALIWNTGRSILVDPVLFVLIIGVLLFQRRGEFSRVAAAATSTWQAAREVRPIPRELASLPEVRWGKKIVAGVLLALALALPLVLPESRINLAAVILIFGVIGLSLVLLTGWAGEISLGQMAFVGIGAAVAGAVTSKLHWDLSISLVLAGLVGAAVASVIGLPALRIRGLFLAVATLAFAVATSSYLLNREFMHWLPTARIGRPPFLGRISVATETRYYYFALAGFGLALAAVRGLRRSRTGRVLIATRENELGALAYGVNITRAKLVAFAFSGFLAAYAGALFVHHQQSLGINPYLPEQSLKVFTMAVFGGLGSASGALVGAAYVQGIDYFLPWGLRFFASGMGLLVVLMAIPGGAGSVVYGVRDLLLRRVARRRGILVPSLVADMGAGPAAEQAGARPPPRVGSSTPSRGPAVIDALEPAGNGALLSVRGLDAGYSGVQVLFGVDFEVRQGDIVANGAGKSTLLRAVSGLVRARKGSIVFAGENITSGSPNGIAARGIIHVPGGRGIFPSLSVEENLRLAGWLFRRDRSYLAAATERVFEHFPVLRERLEQPAGSLSGGEQQMLTLGMALIARPRLLMIDELSLGLAPAVISRLVEIVRAIWQQGTTVILVEQSVNVALSITERAYFMEKGEVRFEGPTRELLRRPDILRSVFLKGAVSLEPGGPAGRMIGGRQREPKRPPKVTEDAPAVLEVRGAYKRFRGLVAVDDVSLTLRQGEILGLIGPNGAGKTTLFDLISGFVEPDTGQVLLCGQDITRLGADARARQGLGRSFQDARLFPALTVAETISLALERFVRVKDPLAAALNLPAVTESEKKVAERTDELIELMELGAFRDKFVAELSTGTRRMVELACMIASQPRVLLLDEPSAGIAQRETEALAPLLLRIQEATGASLLVIEHDMPLVTSVARELVALDCGRLVVRGPCREVLNHPEVVASYLGTSDEAIAPSVRPPRRPRKAPAAGTSAIARATRGAARKPRPGPGPDLKT